MPNIFGYTFTAPAFLLLIPAILAGLVYAYRRGGKGRELLVGTVFLLRELASIPKTRSKFWPPPRFFLELLGLFILALAAAGLISGKFQDNHVVLIDNSPSMAAKVSGVDDSRLLDIAKRDASSFIAGLGLDDGIRVCFVSPELRCLSDGYVGRGEASRSLDEIEIGYSEDRIEEILLSLLMESGSPQIRVFSDKVPSINIPDDSRVKIGTSKDLVRSYQNVAIVGAEIEPGKKNNLFQIELSVAGFIDESIEAKISIESVEALSGSYSFSPLTQKQIKLKPNTIEKAKFEVPRGEAYRATVSLRKSYPYDSILEDNTAYLVPTISTGKALLVSSFGIEELGLNKISNVSFNQRAPEAGLSDVDEFDFVVFHGVAPQQLPNKNSLLINPQANSEFFTTNTSFDGTNKAIEVTSWDEINPITAYLKLPLLKFNQVTPLTPRAGGKLIINSSAGGILVSSEDSSERYVATGFELLPYVGNKNPVLSILTLNIFKWLSGRAVSIGFVSSPLILSSRVSRVSDLLNDSAMSRDGKIYSPGIYEVTEGDSQSLMAVNFFAETESDKLTTQKMAIPAALNDSAESFEDSSGLVSQIIFWIILVLFLDISVQLGTAIKRRSTKV
jgi:hypothetical protein